MKTAARKKTVGTSFRTPAKHNLLRKTVGRVSGAVHHLKPFMPSRASFIDLCAGDGHHVEETDFWHGCSPGILVGHAKGIAGRGMPAHVDLYEINRNTFDSLIGNLVEHIGLPIYVEGGRAEFSITTGRATATVRAILGSGKDADLSTVGTGDCVFVNNDPNTIHDWAMRPGFIQEIHTRTKLCTTFSTMGCNVGGLMMKDANERAAWYDHLNVIQNHLPPWHDLMLAAIDRDAAKWAYLLSVPRVWIDKTEDETRRSFDEIGRNMRVAWKRRSTGSFAQLTDELFLRKSEREESGLW